MSNILINEEELQEKPIKMNGNAEKDLNKFNVF